MVTRDGYVAGPPLGDCFGGALSDDPFVCYLLEQAQAAGMIGVEGVYKGVHDLDVTVYVVISLHAPGAELTSFAQEQAAAAYDAWPLIFSIGEYGKACSGYPRGVWPDCYLASVGTGGWDLELLDGYAFLPWTSYGGPLKLVVGEARRREIPGWASWSQLWPKVAAQEGTGSRSDEVPAFDVSDVDVTNFPEPGEIICDGYAGSDGCYTWRTFPDSGVAGVHWPPSQLPGPRTGYIQIKNPPTDAAEIKALKKRLYPCHDVRGECTYVHHSGGTRRQYKGSTSTIEIIAVKYDYGQLWRWATILERFAVSAGNTRGVQGAFVSANVFHPGPDLIYMNGVRTALKEDDPGIAVYPAIRDTIHVQARNVQRVAAGLPVLLPLLGIPVDAVGMVTWPE